MKQLEVKSSCWVRERLSRRRDVNHPEVLQGRSNRVNVKKTTRKTKETVHERWQVADQVTDRWTIYAQRLHGCISAKRCRLEFFFILKVVVFLRKMFQPLVLHWAECVCSSGTSLISPRYSLYFNVISFHILCFDSFHILFFDISEGSAEIIPSSLKICESWVSIYIKPKCSYIF